MTSIPLDRRTPENLDSFKRFLIDLRDGGLSDLGPGFMLPLAVLSPEVPAEEAWNVVDRWVHGVQHRNAPHESAEEVLIADLKTRVKGWTAAHA